MGAEIIAIVGGLGMEGGKGGVEKDGGSEGQ